MAHQKQHLASDPPHAGGSLPAGGARPGTKISAAGEYESALRGLLVTETTSHDASQPICRQQKKVGTVDDPTVPT